MSEVINAFLLAFAALFPIVNPVGGAPIFLALTQHLRPEVRRGLALRIAINGFCLLVASLFVGSHVLEFFGITLPVVRIGGGLVVTAFAWKLLNDDSNASDKKAHEAGDPGEADPALDAFYPLTMPLTVGPGSISVAITLGSQRPKTPAGFDNLLLLAGGAVAGVLALAVTIYVRIYPLSTSTPGVLENGIRRDGTVHPALACLRAGCGNADTQFRYDRTSGLGCQRSP